MRKLIFCFLFFACLHASAQDEEVMEEPQVQEDTEVIFDEDYATGEDLHVDHESVAPSQAATTRQYKDERIYHKGFDENKWRDIIGDNDFIESPPEQEEDTPMRKPAFEGGSEILKAIGYGVIIAIVILLLYFVVKNIKVGPRIRKPGITPFTNESPEDIHDLDIQGMLKTALNEGNLKMAVRLYYLLLLRNLDGAGLIRWEKDKTNRDYLSELFSSETYYDDVRKLTLKYEEVWYGDHHFPDETLRSLINRFETLQGRIKPSKNP